MATDRDIWEQAAWQTRRAECLRYRNWYDGKPLQETQPARDRSSGDVEEKFPLRLNIHKLSADIHRDLARGMPYRDDTLFVQTAIDRGSNDDNSERISNLEEVINYRVWEASRGAAIQQEALLSMNIYGAVAYKLSWEPWDPDLPTGLAVRLIRDPSLIYPFFDYLNPGRLLECYFGYEIDPDTAEKKYGIKSESDYDKMLYMEHWTPDKYEVKVNDKVPTMVDRESKKEWELSGDNPFGFVPFYYIPHERTTRLFGDSELQDQDGISKEVNARAVTISDLVRAIKTNIYVGRDIKAQALKVRQINKEGVPVAYWIDIGTTTGMVNARPPELEPLEIPDIPESLTSWPMQLLQFWMMMERISPASFGLDDTRSGRITGPAVAQRMWTSLSHAVTERTNYSTIKNLLDRDIIKALLTEEVRDRASVNDIDLGFIQKRDKFVRLWQSWPPMIPLDKVEQLTQLVAQAGAKMISAERFLSEMDVGDIAGERQRILDWQKEVAEIEAQARPPMFGGEGGNRGQPQNQGV